MRKLLLIPVLLLTACSLQAVPDANVTPSLTPPLFATATLIATLTPRPTATASIPTIVPTITPILATVTTQVNVRRAPNKNADSLGLLAYGSKAQVIGKDNGGQWWKIIYPENSITTGWVSMAYVQVSEDDALKIPVLPEKTLDQANQTTTSPAAQGETTSSSVASATATPPAHMAKVKNQIFVRSGPGQNFDSLGQVNAGTTVILTGRNQNNVWIQIKFDSGTGGKGWVAGAYLEGANLQDLPFFDNQGNELASGGTAGANPGQPTLTATAFSPAAADADTESNPAVRMKFAPDGVREFTFSSDLSSPTGDTTDWVAFTPYDPANQSTFVYFKLKCSGNGGITATLEKDGVRVPDSKSLVCGNYGVAMQVLGGKEYSLVLNADGSGGPLRYVKYDLFISSQP